LAPELETRHRLVAFDLPGFGDSDKPDVAYDLPFFVDALSQVADAFDLRRFALVGHSLGGLIAAEYAGLAPERVASLGLIDPAGFTRSGRLVLLMLASAPASRLFRARPSDGLVRRVLRRALYDPAQLERATAERACALAHEAGVIRAFARVYAGGFAQLGRMRALHAGFTRYQGPVALLWGRHDRYISVRSLEAARRVYPRARTSIFERSAHLPAVEEPAAVAAALSAIL
jgi:pimeloyl-ACP methyl ester carboxylesterase